MDTKCLSISQEDDQLSVNMQIEQQKAPEASRYAFLEVLSIYPIFDALCSHLDIASFLSLQRVSKQLAANFYAQKNRRWDIDKGLRRFVREPKAFRCQMGKLDAIISGSFMLQFYEEIVWEEDTVLDIYLPSEALRAMYQYLCLQEGYATDESFGEDGNILEIVNLVNYYHPGRFEEEDLQVK